MADSDIHRKLFDESGAASDDTRVRELLEAGADPNGSDKNLCTPLAVMSQRGYYEGKAFFIMVTTRPNSCCISEYPPTNTVAAA